MGMKTEYSFEISKNVYCYLKKKKYVLEYPQNFYSTKDNDCIVFTEPNTQQSFEVKTPEVVEAVGEHRKVSLVLKKEPNFIFANFNFGYRCILSLTLKF